MTEAVATAVFDCGIQKVWNTVTSLENYGWRSDIARIDILGENSFAEFTKDGFVTTFYVTEQIPCHVWRFEMENANMKGDWCGEFEQLGGRTKVVFTERVTVKKPLLKPVVKIYLKFQQKKYITDLEKALK